jgi:hypothetical protein
VSRGAGAGVEDWTGADVGARVGDSDNTPSGAAVVGGNGPEDWLGGRLAVGPDVG